MLVFVWIIGLNSTIQHFKHDHNQFSLVFFSVFAKAYTTCDKTKSKTNKLFQQPEVNYSNSPICVKYLDQRRVLLPHFSFISSPRPGNVQMGATNGRLLLPKKLFIYADTTIVVDLENWHILTFFNWRIRTLHFWLLNELLPFHLVVSACARFCFTIVFTFSCLWFKCCEFV